MLSVEELVAVDDFRFAHRMPSRASAVRELLRLGLNAVGIDVQRHRKSSDYGVIDSSMRNGEGDGTANER